MVPSSFLQRGWPPPGWKLWPTSVPFDARSSRGSLCCSILPTFAALVLSPCGEFALAHIPCVRCLAQESDPPVSALVRAKLAWNGPKLSDVNRLRPDTGQSVHGLADPARPAVCWGTCHGGMVLFPEQVVANLSLLVPSDRKSWHACEHPPCIGSAQACSNTHIQGG